MEPVTNGTPIFHILYIAYWDRFKLTFIFHGIFLHHKIISS